MIRFATPIWLLGLIPWAVVVMALLVGWLKRERVPFLPFWQGPAAKPRQRRLIEPPPLAVVLAMLALLLAVLAAASPGIRRVDRPGQPIRIILDRGITMSAIGAGEPRFRELAGELAGALGAFPADLVVIPGDQRRRIDVSQLPDIARELPPTAADVRHSLQAVVAELLRDSDQPIILISDQPPAIASDRLVTVSPQGQPDNLAIVRFGVRQTPRPQAMLRLRNQSPLRSATLRLVSDGREVLRQAIDLPANGESNYFFDVPAPGRWIEASVEAEDRLQADNRAYLARRQAWPIVEARSPVSAELARVIAAYSRIRVVGEQSPRVAVVALPDAPLSGEPAALVAAPSLAPTTRPAQSPDVVDHPITRPVVDWNAVFASVAIGPAAPDATWTPLISISGQPVLAVRQPPRQVWVGFHSPTWSSTPDYVVFWSAVFDWLGQGGETFATEPVGPLPPAFRALRGNVPEGLAPGLWPGVYSDAEGKLRAVSALDVRMSPPAETDWRRAVAALSGRASDAAWQRPLAPVFLLAAVTVVLGSALTWRRVTPRSRSRS